MRPARAPISSKASPFAGAIMRRIRQGGTRGGTQTTAIRANITEQPSLSRPRITLKYHLIKTFTMDTIAQKMPRALSEDSSTRMRSIIWRMSLSGRRRENTFESIETTKCPATNVQSMWVSV